MQLHEKKKKLKKSMYQEIRNKIEFFYITYDGRCLHCSTLE